MMTFLPDYDSAEWNKQFYRTNMPQPKPRCVFCEAEAERAKAAMTCRPEWHEAHDDNE